MYDMVSLMGFPGGTNGKEPVCQYRRLKRRKMATHSSIVAWRIPWTEEPRGHKN